MARRPGCSLRSSALSDSAIARHNPPQSVVIPSFRGRVSVAFPAFTHCHGLIVSPLTMTRHSEERDHDEKTLDCRCRDCVEQQCRLCGGQEHVHEGRRHRRLDGCNRRRVGWRPGRCRRRIHGWRDRRRQHWRCEARQCARAGARARAARGAHRAGQSERAHRWRHDVR